MNNQFYLSVFQISIFDYLFRLVIKIKKKKKHFCFFSLDKIVNTNKSLV